MRTANKLLLRSLSVLAVLATCGVGVAEAADWDIGVSKTGPTSADVSWRAEVGEKYWICWKPTALGGDVCGYNGLTTDVTIYSPTSGLTNTNYVNGRKTVRLHSLTCGQEYRVRIRRTLVAFDTYTFWFPC